MEAPDFLSSHCHRLVRLIGQGRVVPFLGAGVNLCDRPVGAVWTLPSRTCLPASRELAGWLANNFGFPQEPGDDLARVCQFVATTTGVDPLYNDLREVFNSDYPPTLLHRFLAMLPARLREQGSSNPCQLIVTTNYDDLLERAFDDADEEYDSVIYLAEGPNRGKFLHRKWADGHEVIDIPNAYTDLPIDDETEILDRTIILKIHGTVDRTGGSGDSYVITEDDYIDYLARADAATLLPMKLASKFSTSHFLFMGYGLRDWNLRLILHRIWGQRVRSRKSWAIQREPDLVDEGFWRSRDVEILRVDLKDYVPILASALGLGGFSA